MGDDLVAALADRRHDLRRVVVKQAVGIVRGGQLELVEQLEQAPYADAIAVVAPRVIAVRLGLAGLGRIVPEAGAIGEPLDIAGEQERQPLAAGPAVVLALRQRHEVIAAVLRQQRLQSSLAPEALTMGASLVISRTVAASNSSGVMTIASAPSCSKTFWISGDCTVAAKAEFSRRTSARSMPFGPSTPEYSTMSKSGSPASIMVGTSGAAATRFGVVTASARSLPALAFDTAGGMVENTNVTSPPRIACVAGLLPLYGTCSTSTPAACFSISADRWTMVPLPEEPYEYLPGFDLSSSISSRTLCAGVVGCTTSISGVEAIIAM